MNRCLLATLRFLVPAWVGAAGLFVVVGVLEITSPQFDSFVRDSLVAIRFPAYYVAGAGMLSLALLAGVALSVSAGSSRRIQIGTVLVLIALIVMIVDYVWIFSPLLEMVTPPGKARGPEFEPYHRASESINSLMVLLSVVAAGLFCWPMPQEPGQPSAPQETEAA